ncbi:MAG: methyltransferase domain-containing protein [Alphaproteobacteria bacterium]|nr:MAG: methyltransferase domain-containing protein [Alphaproteobacteria bacterium]
MQRFLNALKAVAEPTRLRLLALLAHGELTVSELVRILRQSQPRISRHLKLLAEAGLVERLQEGAWAFYRLADRSMEGTLARRLVAMLEAGEPGELARDRKRLDDVKAERQAAADAYFRANAADWDRIRALYVPEREVEAALLAATEGEATDELLDVGTGTGRMLELFAPSIRYGIGVDMNREMLAIARARLDRAGHHHCHVRLGDMYALGLPAGAFDIVIFHQVLHFADNPPLALAEAARVLKAGGSLLIADFAPHQLEYLRTEHAHRRLGFGEAEMARWCEAAGLDATVAARLPGEALSVILWKARKPADAARRAA